MNVRAAAECVVVPVWCFRSWCSVHCQLLCKSKYLKEPLVQRRGSFIKGRSGLCPSLKCVSGAAKVMVVSTSLPQTFLLKWWRSRTWTCREQLQLNQCSCGPLGWLLMLQQPLFRLPLVACLSLLASGGRRWPLSGFHSVMEEPYLCVHSPHSEYQVHCCCTSSLSTQKHKLTVFGGGWIFIFSRITGIPE